MDKQGWTLGIGSDLRVVGSCGEMADMSNPRGEITKPVWFVTAEKDGEVFGHALPEPWTTRRDDESGLSVYVGPDIGDGGDKAAQKELEAVLARGSNPDSEPGDWWFWRTAYGSNAYLAEVAGMSDEQRADYDPNGF
jgi:hypothetical protein